MKVHIEQADLKLAADFQIYANHKPLIEHTCDSLNDLPVNHAATWLGVRAGDELTIRGHIDGNFLAATIDFLVDGIFMGSKKFDSRAFAVQEPPCHANLITGLARVPYGQSEEMEVCELKVANLYQVKRERRVLCPPGLLSNVGRIEVIISAQTTSNDSYENTDLNCQSYDWRCYEQGTHSGAMIPRHNIRLFRRRTPQPGHAEQHRDDQFRKRPGKGPLAKLVFYYRTLEELKSSVRFPRSKNAVIKLRPVSHDEAIAIGLHTPKSPISDQTIQHLDSSDLFVSEDEDEIDNHVDNRDFSNYGGPTSIGAIANQARDLSADGSVSKIQAEPAREILRSQILPRDDHLDQAKLSLRPARPTTCIDSNEQPIHIPSAFSSASPVTRMSPACATMTYLNKDPSQRDALNVSSEYDKTASRVVEVEKILRTATPPRPMASTNVNLSQRSPPRDPRLRRPQIPMLKTNEGTTCTGASGDLSASHRSPLAPPSDPRSCPLSTHHADSEPSVRQANDISRKHTMDSTDLACISNEPAKRSRIDFVARKKELTAQVQHRRALRLKREEETRLREEQLQREIAELEKELQHEDDLLRDLLLSEDGEAMGEHPVI